MARWRLLIPRRRVGAIGTWWEWHGRLYRWRPRKAHIRRVAEVAVRLLDGGSQ